MAYLLVNQNYKNNYPNDDLWSIIDKAIAEDKLTELVIVVPTSKLVRHYKSRIIRKYAEVQNKPIAELNIFSFIKFVNHCTKTLLATEDIKFLSEAYSLTIFEEAIKQCELKYFSNQDMSSTLLKRLFSIVTGLREDGISANTIQQDINSISATSPEDESRQESDLVKMGDMQTIISAYETALGSKYLDASGTLIRLNNELFAENSQFNVNSIFPNSNAILFNDFTDFKQPEAELLNKFAESKYSVAIHVDFSSNEGPLLGGYETTIINLHKQGYQIESINGMTEASDSPANFLRKNLFKHRGFKDKTDKFNDIIRIVSVKSRIEEVKFIGRLIKELSINQNIPLHEICISSRQPENYADLFREIFYQYNIPSNVTNRIPLNNSPLIVSIFAFFDIVLKNYRKNDIARAFGSDYINGALFKQAQLENIDSANPLLKAETLASNALIKHFNIDIQNLIYVANKLRISGGNNNGGMKQWEFSFRNSIENFTKRIDTFNTEIENGNEDIGAELSSAKKDLERIQKAKEDFDVIKSLINFPKKLTAEQFSKLIKKEILRKFRVYDAIISKYDTISVNFKNQSETENLMIFENIEKESRAFYAFLQVLDEFVYIQKDRYGDQIFSLSELVKNFKTAIDGKKYQIREKLNYGVTVTSVEQTRGIPYRVNILCGMLDNEFPLRYRPEVFLGKEVPDTETRHYINEKLQFYQFLSNNPAALESGDKLIFLTYPEFEEKNKLVQSPFIDYLLNITSLNDAGKYFRIDAKSKDYGDELINNITNVSASNIEITDKLELHSEIIDSPEMQDFKDSISESSELNHYFNYLNSDYNPETAEGININIIPADKADNLSKLKNKVYSVTEFDGYSACSIKYLYERILKLKIDEELDLSLSPLELGNLIHRILYLFYKEQRTIQYNAFSVLLKSNSSDSIHLQDKDIFLVRLNQEQREAYLESLKAIARQEINQIKYDHPLFKMDFESIMGDSKRKGLLEYWLDEELAKYSDGKWNFNPALFEIEFGEKQKDSYRKYIKFDNGLKVSGKIDRIEFLKTFSNDIQFMIADYKSNAKKQATNKEIQNFEKFQIPIYLKAAKNYIETNFQIPENTLISPAGGVYYSYKNGRTRSDKKSRYSSLVVIPDDNNLQTRYNGVSNINEFLDEVSDKAFGITQDISNGIFALPENDKPCRFCKLETICRIKDYKPQLSDIAEEIESTKDYS